MLFALPVQGLAAALAFRLGLPVAGGIGFALLRVRLALTFGGLFALFARTSLFREPVRLTVEFLRPA